MLPSSPWRERRAALRSLFEGIAPSYDRLNHFLSLGIDRSWRARAAREAVSRSEEGRVLDLASGTGDQAAALLRRAPRLTVFRLDLSGALLARAGGKLRGDGANRAPGATPPIVGEMECLPVRDGSCAAITMAFALRHVESLTTLMGTCYRALGPGGRISFVDMSIPTHGFWSAIYRFYFIRCLPRIAQLLGGEREAYELMVRSVAAFPGWEALEGAACQAGFEDVRSIRLTGGSACVFVARKYGALATGAPEVSEGSSASARIPSR
jgi:demethylmenaquinone methyltransferase / 2-methoxy-6-polyprenyl-1,4-benzoquinol methylase